MLEPYEGKLSRTVLRGERGREAPDLLGPAIKMEKRYSQDIEGEVTYIPTDRGGRSVPAYSGYRPQFFYNGNDWDAVQHFPDVEKVNPGDTVKVIFTFLSPEEHFGNLEEGTIFLIREGSRTIGYGKVTRILELEKSATKAMESEKRG